MLDALRRWLAPAGIELDDAIHEYGPGQLEVNFPPGRGLAARRARMRAISLASAEGLGIVGSRHG